MVRRNVISFTEREILRLGDALADAGLLLDRNFAHTYLLGGRVTRLAWNNYSISAVTEFATVQEYISLIRDRQYTYVFFDGSLMQVVYYFRNRRIVQHNLGFYSPPVPILPDALREYLDYGLTLQDLVIDRVESDDFASNLRLKSPIRFDFDAHNNTVDHPASHLHLSQSDCRIAVSAPLSIGHFVRFVFRYFYPEHWKQCQFIRRWPCIDFQETIMSQQKKLLHIGCARQSSVI